MFFIHPHYLWLLLLLVPLVWQHRQHRTSLGAISLWSLATLRALALAALIIALARPVLLREDRTQTIVHLIDISAGVDQESLNAVVEDVEHAVKKIKKNEQHKIILFAQNRWQLESLDTLQGEIARLRKTPDNRSLDGSDLAAAVDLATMSIREGAAGEVRLYSDGRATAGNMPTSVQDLARRGLSLKTITIGKPLSRELILREVKVAPTAMLGETLPVNVVVEATDPGVVRAAIVDTTGKEVVHRQLPINSGRQTLNLTLPVTLPGTASFEVRLQSEKDTLTTNNQKPFAVEVLPAYRVGLIGTSESASLAALLGPSSEIQAISPKSLKAAASPTKNLSTQAKNPSAPIKNLSAQANSLAQFDLIVLADTPVETLGPDVVAQLTQAVKDGCGLLVTGGQRSFGPGGYLDGPLAQLLPVRSVQKMEQRDPSSTLVIIIDTSSSMGGARVQLAKEIARLAIQRLKPHDKAGVVEFYGSKRWAAPIQPASNAIDINRALNRLSAGGGTVILPAIEEAYYALLNVRTRTRHVLVLTDGGVETGPFEPLIRKMADKGITLSTVLVGPSSHSTFLTRLAQWGRGKSYHAPSRFNLPEILVKQPESSLLSPWIERPTQMVPADRSSLTDAIDFNHAPLITGYVETESRRTADVLIRSTLGHPILARWQYGLGRVAILTTQLSGPWSKELATWDGYGRLMAGLARSLVKRTERIPIQLDSTIGPEGLTILAKATTPDPSHNSASLELTITTASDETIYRTTLEPIHPGQWLVRIALASLLDAQASSSQNILRLKAKTSTGLFSCGAVAVGPSDEFCSVSPARNLMADWEQACSREQAKMKESRNTTTTPQAVSPRDLRTTLLSLALILFFLQIASRRLLPSVIKKLATSATAILLLLLLNASTFASTTTQPKNLLSAEVIEQVQAAYKKGDAEQARAILTNAIKKTPAASSKNAVTSHAARLAWICDDPKTAAELLRPSGKGKQRCREELLLGSLLLDTDRAAQAIKHFQKAYQTATTSTDRRFAVAMHVHSARKAKSLDRLANQWLAKRDLPQDQLRLLIQVLGELDRHEDAFRLLERPDLSDNLSEDLQKDVVSLAIDAGKTERAMAVYRRLLHDHPSHIPYLSAAARLYLLDNRRSKAISLFNDAIRATNSTTQPKSLFRLASAAADLALYDQARAALDKAASASETSRITSVIKKADLTRREGNPDRAIQLLASLRSTVDDKPKQLLAVAEAYERYGDRVEAFTLMKRLYKLTGSEDILAQVAWLCEESNRFDEAYELWLKLWRQTKVTARRNQAKTRLLDIASRTSRLVDLVIDIEEKIDEGRATHEEVMLLVDIYSQVNDPISASEILYSFGKKFGNQRDAAKRLVRVYIDCDLFARADDQLKKLIEIDPENASEYLEQIAMLAVERGRPYEAFVAVEKLNASQNTSDHAAEFSAGLFELLGMYDEAISAYEKVLTEKPDHVEVLLLWGRAMKLAGRGEEAIQRMLNIAKTCDKDDQFVIAIDGLLNLEARPKVLHEALAMIERRLAVDWNKVFLYDLASDLLDNLGDSDRKLRVLQQSLVASGMRRPTVLRQLMDEAAINPGKSSATKLVVDHGRLLLALGDEVPPSVFLQIGKAMLDAKDIKTAATIFRRATVHDDFADIGRRVASLYEESGRLQQAESTLHELLITEPDSVDLLIQAGELSEQMGHFPRAFDSYLKAVNRLLDRVPPVVRSKSQPKNSRPPRYRYYRRSFNRSEIDLYMESATIGLVSSARSEKSQASLLETFTQQVEQELAELKKKGHRKPTLDENPRLARRVVLLRRIAFSLHRPVCITQIDQAILSNYPKDKTLFNKTVDHYIKWGFLDTAATFAASFPKQSKPQTLRIYQLLKDKKSLNKFIDNPKRSSSIAEALIPILFAKGRSEDAKRLLTEIPDSRKRISTVYVAASALDHTKELAAWAKSQTQLSFSTSRLAIFYYRRTIDKIWSGLDQPSRETFLKQIATTADKMSKDRYPFDLLRLQLTTEGDVVTEVMKDEKTLIGVISTHCQNAFELKKWLTPLSSKQRVSALKAFINRQTEQKRRRVLLNLLHEADSLNDPALFDLIVGLFKASPRMEVRKENAYARLTSYPWYRVNSPTAKVAATKITKQLLEDQGPITAISTLHAISTSRLIPDTDKGRSPSPQAILFEAIGRITSQKMLGYQEKRLLMELVKSLSSSDAEVLTTRFEKQAKQDGMTAPLAFAQACLYKKLGNTRGKLNALEKVFILAAGDTASSSSYIASMKKLGRDAELVDTLAANLKGASVSQSYQCRMLADLYYKLYRFEEAILTTQKDNSKLAPIQTVKIETARNNPDAALSELRCFFAKNRKQRRYYSPTCSEKPGPGGMQEFLTKPRSSSSFWQNQKIFETLADQPYAVDEWGAMLRAAEPNRYDLPDLIVGYAKALQFAGKANEMIDAIRTWQTQGIAGKKDHLLLLALQKDSQKAPRLKKDLQEKKLPSNDQASSSLLVGLDETLLSLNWFNRRSVTQLARILIAADKKNEARLVLRWAIAVTKSNRQREFRYADAWEPIDLLVDTYPITERSEQMLVTLKRLAPSPIASTSYSEFDTERFSRLFSHLGSGDKASAMLQQELVTYRQRLANDSSRPTRDALALLAALEASLDHFDDFKKAINETLDTDPKRLYNVEVWDYRRLLPSAKAMKHAEKYFAAVLAETKKRHTKKQISQAEYVRALCLLSEWQVTNKVENTELRNEIKNIAKQIESNSLFKVDPNTTLWLVDYYHQVGDTSSAYRLSKLLLENRTYPPARFPWLLPEIEKREGKKERQSAIKAAKTYSAHPILFQSP